MAQETNRSNLAREFETNRHNVATEQVAINSLNETIRNNRATLAEGKRHNLANEKETNRSNLARESLTRDQNIETSRHNLELERQGIISLNETNRHNIANEGLQGEANAINSRRNDIAAESNQIQRDYNQGMIDIHNRQNEISQYNADTNRINALNTASRIATQNTADMMNAGSNRISAQANSNNASTNRYNADTNRMNAKTSQETNTIRRLQVSAQQMANSIKSEYLNKVDIPGGEAMRNKYAADVKLAEEKIKSERLSQVQTGYNILSRAVKDIKALLGK